MERRCYRFIFYFGLLFPVLGDKAQSITIEAVQGDSVILPCSARGYEKDVFWRCNTTKTVYDIIEGKEDLYEQDAAYRGRVDGFPSKFREGNYSIRLKNVILADSGTYSCQIPYTNTVYVELKLNGSGRNSGITTSTDWVTVFLLICVLMYRFAL